MDKQGMVSCSNLLCEYMRNPIGIDAPKPRLSWISQSSYRAMKQQKYHIQVAYSNDSLLHESDLVWDSMISSKQSTHIPYEGLPLISSQCYFWRVRIQDSLGIWTAWSESASWEMGLLRTQDWKAKFIEPTESTKNDRLRPSPYLRNTFEITHKVISARVYVTSHGIFELHLNGNHIGTEVFAPGFTSYHERLQYRVYDISDYLLTGINAIGIILGDGWFRGKLTIASFRDVYGTKLGALLQIQIQYSDGQQHTIISDDHWKWSFGPILRSDPKDGEIYDARLEMQDWTLPTFDDSLWKFVQISSVNASSLVASMSPPIKRQETFKPINIFVTPKGQTVIDFGQNIAGRIRMKVTGVSGDNIILRHGESLDAKGNFSLQHLQPSIPGTSALLQEDRYTLKGSGLEVYEPHFSVHGFRYVEVCGWPCDLHKDQFTAIALYSDMERIGTFECSNTSVNRLYENIVWSMKGNSFDIPTDCPTRERAGWTGDVQIFARTGCFLMNMNQFLGKWLIDLSLDQHVNGLVPNTIPDNTKRRSSALSELVEGSAGWGDAAIIIPWILYQAYGNVHVLKAQYESMRKWIEYGLLQSKHGSLVDHLNPLHGIDAHQLHREPYIWNSGYHWGEWLAPGDRIHVPLTMARNILSNRKSETMVATAYLSHSANLISKIADVLNKSGDSIRYHSIHRDINEAFVEEFTANGRLHLESQASYIRVLMFDILPESFRQIAADRLACLIQENGNHLDTGFLSTPFLCHVLSRFGFTDLAYTLLLQDTYPSWLYQIRKGATTIWENWDAVDETNSVHGSLNHVAFGSIGSWLHETVAGIKINECAPGYSHFELQPKPGGNLSSVKATLQSPYGEILSKWCINKEMMEYHIAIPPNTTATITLPNAQIEQINESGNVLSSASGLCEVKQSGYDVKCNAGSGKYIFKWPITNNTIKKNS